MIGRSTWPDGSPRSQGNAFDIAAQVYRIDSRELDMRTRQRGASTKQVQKARDDGTIMAVERTGTPQHLARAPHGGAYMKAAKGRAEG